MNSKPRPLRGDGEATRASILEAAGEMFAADGLAATTNKAISARAGVDSASINYHFGSRNGLYQAVLAEAHRKFVSLRALQDLHAAEIPAFDKLKELIRTLVEGAAVRDGWHARVLARELLSPTPHLKTLERDEILPKVQILLGLLQDLTGFASDDPALLRCLISIGAPCAMLLVAGGNRTQLADQLFGMPRQALVDHLYSFAVGGLEAVRRQRASI